MRANYFKFFLVVLALLAFWPLISLGPITQDDNSWLLVFNEVITSSASLQEYWAYTTNYAKMQGRLGFFISFPLISFPYLFTNIFVVAAIKLASILVLVVSLHHAVRYFSDSIHAALAVLVFAALHTLSWYHSGFVSYSIQFFLLISVFLFSLIWFDRYVQTGRTSFLLGASFLYFFCLSIEIFYVLYPAYFLVGILRSPPSRPLAFLRERRVLAGMGALMLAGVVYFIAYLAFRASYASTYAGNQIAADISLGKYLATNLKMSLAAVPGLLPLVDRRQWGAGSLVSADGIVYNAASLFVLPALVWLRRITLEDRATASSPQATEPHPARRVACSILAAYLFIAAASLPSLTSTYQSILLEHGHWGYIYTFLAFIVFAAFVPSLIVRALKAKPSTFWAVAIFLAVVSLFARGYSQTVFDEMTSASQRWAQFESFLKTQGDLRNQGCLRSSSLFQAAYLVDVTDDYWTRFARTHKPGLVEGTTFIRDGKLDPRCVGSPGRFEFISDGTGRHLGWYLASADTDGKGRQLRIYLERPVRLFVSGPAALRDQAENVFVPDKTRAIVIVPGAKRVAAYSMVGDDVSVASSGFATGQVLQMLEGFYPAESLPDGGVFWWARGTSSFSLVVDPLSLPDALGMRLVVAPVGAKAGDELALQCDKSPVRRFVIGAQPEAGIEIDLPGAQLSACKRFQLVPSWPEVLLSAGDTRRFSFKVANVRFYSGEIQ